MTNPYPTFLLRNVPPELRQEMEIDAQDTRRPIQEVIRSILCEHYGLECVSIQGAIRRDAWEGSTTMLVLLQRELFEAIKQRSEETSVSMRALMISALEAHYERTPA